MVDRIEQIGNEKMSGPVQTTVLRILKWSGIVFGFLVVLAVLMVEVVYIEKMADDYRASIVRDTIAAMKEANVR